MIEFSIAEKENLEKLRAIFDTHSSDGKHLKPKELLKFVAQIGLNHQFFLKDISYYYPNVQNGQSLTFKQIVKFLDYILTHDSSNLDKMQAFKSFDKNGSGQINSAQLLGILKKRLSPKEYDQYVQLISNSYGPLINYIDFFKKAKSK